MIFGLFKKKDKDEDIKAIGILRKTIAEMGVEKEQIVERQRREVDYINKDHELKVLELNKKHELELKDEAFKLAHASDERVKKAEEEAAQLRQKVAVLEKENEMLGKITDLNADVIDVKKLVSDLIGKLPEIKISNLSVSPSNKE